jgi:hypothetical protein
MKTVIFFFCYLLLFNSNLIAEDKKAPISIDDVIKLAAKKADGFGLSPNANPFQLQVALRLQSIQNYHKYDYQKDHAVKWKGCLQDEKANIYGRVIAAYYLLL